MDKIQDAINIIDAQCGENSDVLEASASLENHINNLETKLHKIQTRMKEIFKDVCEDQHPYKNEAQFTAAARACSVVGISIDEMKEIEAKIN